jgi:hypothetical protein
MRRLFPPLGGLRYGGPVKFRSFAPALFLGLSLSVSPAAAHDRVELTVAGGYQFGITRGISSVQFDTSGAVAESEGRVHISAAPVFTAMAGLRIQHDGFIYLSYSRSRHTFDYDMEGDGDEVPDFSGEGAIESYQFGGNLEMTRGIWVPYLGASVGLGHVISFGADRNRFSFSPVLDAGLKVDLHRHVHLRFMGKIPFYFNDGDFYCTSENECLSDESVGVFATPQLMVGLTISF